MTEATPCCTTCPACGCCLCDPCGGDSDCDQGETWCTCRTVAIAEGGWVPGYLDPAQMEEA